MAQFIVYDTAQSNSGNTSFKLVLRWGACADEDVADQADGGTEVARAVTVDLDALYGQNPNNIPKVYYHPGADQFVAGTEVVEDASVRGYATGENYAAGSNFENEARNPWDMRAGFYGLSTNAAKAGVQSLRLDAHSAARIYPLLQPIEVAEGEVLFFRIWVRANSAYDGGGQNLSKLRIANAQTDALLGEIGYAASDFAARNEWVKKTLTFTVPAGVTEILPQLTADHTAGLLYIDLVKIVKRKTEEDLDDAAVKGRNVDRPSLLTDLAGDDTPFVKDTNISGQLKGAKIWTPTLALPDRENLLSDPEMEDPAAWGFPSLTRVRPGSPLWRSQYALVLSGAAGDFVVINSGLFIAEPDERFFAQAQGQVMAGTGRVGAQIQWFDKDLVSLGFSAVGSGIANAGVPWTFKTNGAVAPAGTYYGRLQLIKYNDGATEVRVGGPVVRRKVKRDLVMAAAVGTIEIEADATTIQQYGVGSGHALSGITSRVLVSFDVNRQQGYRTSLISSFDINIQGMSPTSDRARIRHWIERAGVELKGTSMHLQRSGQGGDGDLTFAGPFVVRLTDNNSVGGVVQYRSRLEVISIPAGATINISNVDLSAEQVLR
ncbi:hypothetical protein [Wenxinia saemankumensis]|uniref:Uncharacterized protein n=1 Tax=Wenxinia saemankumensis TaxID=1447782 RepID=A0A1M6F0J8_9RHOB|nr:hypothetical protein [Wenxinia saemankumensis]SHI91185.1 hypothetical protein SAMN05444417_2283 [Wenxinia saemankumensis]